MGPSCTIVMGQDVMANTSSLRYTSTYGLTWHSFPLGKRSGDNGNLSLCWSQSRHIRESLRRCQGALKAIFLSDLTTADGKYLEGFVFTPGGRKKASTFKFPQEQPTLCYWNLWFNFWHNCTTTRYKLKVPLGNWLKPTHRIWKWYYRADTDELQRVKDNIVFHYKLSSGFCFTRAMRKYNLMWDKPLLPSVIQGMPTSVSAFTIQQVIKLSEGLALAEVTDHTMDFGGFFVVGEGSGVGKE